MSLGNQLGPWLAAIGRRRATARRARINAQLQTGQQLKTALLASATTVIAYPVAAQQAPEPVPLPPLNVEAAAKKKAPAKKAAAKKAPTTTQVSPTPQPSQPVAQKSDPLPGEAGAPRRAASMPPTRPRRR
ncbi:MAG: hypothetical protein WDN31_13125 [Hyphomicrobium sp.]